jgi:hypothetical protein
MAFIAGRVVVTVFRARQGDRVTVWSTVQRNDVSGEGGYVRRLTGQWPKEARPSGGWGNAAWHH